MEEGKNTKNDTKRDIKSERVKLHFAETARKIIMDEGVEAVSVRKVASQAGYSFATIYNHFKNIDELLWYTRNIMIKDIYEHMGNFSYSKIESTDEVVNIFRTYLDYFIQNPNIFRFFYFYHLDGTAKPDENFVDEVDFNKQYASTFDFLSRNGQRSLEEILVISKTLIYSIHGMLTLYISDNDDLKIEDIYQGLNDMIHLLIK